MMKKRNSHAGPILSEMLEEDLLQGAEGTLERALCNVQKNHGAFLCASLTIRILITGCAAFER